MNANKNGRSLIWVLKADGAEEWGGGGIKDTLLRW